MNQPSDSEFPYGFLDCWISADILAIRERYRQLNQIPKRKDQCPACSPEARGLASAVYIFLQRERGQSPSDTRYVTSKLIKVIIEVEALRDHSFSHAAFVDLWQAAEALVEPVRQGYTRDEVILNGLIDRLSRANDVAQSFVLKHFFDFEHKYGE